MEASLNRPANIELISKKKTDRRHMLKIAHIQEEKAQEPAQKRVPLYKDPAFMAQLARDFIRDHNAKFDKKQANHK